MSFEMQPKERKKRGTAVRATFHQDDDFELFERFTAVARSAGVSKAEALRQCVRYALDNMNSTDADRED